MGNVALMKNASASSFMAPYSPSRAVDGSIQPIQRWVCSSVPCWMMVDLGALYWINRWVVIHMGSAGWQSPSYNMMDYKLQISLDAKTWSDVDSVVGNTINKTDRTINAVKTRYVRIYTTRGIAVNNQLASIVDLQIYEAPPTSAYLSNLVISTGSLSPAFSPTTGQYTANAGFDIESITVTPTAQDPNATIKVDGQIVLSGQASGQIPLTAGQTKSILIEVTPVIGNPYTYTVNVTRASSPYLTKVNVNYTDRTGSKVVGIDIVPGTFNYTADVPTGVKNVTLTPYAADPQAAIKVDGQNAASGQASQQITLNASGDTVIPVNVESHTGTDKKEYTICVK
ncbi:MAG: cadherin-like beta sandwich domain-containing protein [Clostridia bacterium]|nr:cadherin-like beta sandwich domain-containing protein [Clostridia bacterium]